MTSLATALLVGVTPACGAVINGTTQTIELRAADPNAEIYALGTRIGTGQASLTGSPADPPVAYVRDSTGAFARFEAETNVSGAAIALDVLWCLTIVGVAAPLSDLAMGTFRGLDQPQQPIAASPSAVRSRTIEYAREPAPLVETYRPREPSSIR